MTLTKGQLDTERRMFGCTGAEIDDLVKYHTKTFGNAKGLATAMLSDAQDLMEHTALIGKSNKEQVRHLINKAKYIIHEFTNAKKI